MHKQRQVNIVTLQTEVRRNICSHLTDMLLHPSQDRSTNKHVALKISTKPMYTCDDDEVAVHLIDKPDFHKKLHNDVWEMR